MATTILSSLPALFHRRLDESGRSINPLEVLVDLTLVTAIVVSASQLVTYSTLDGVGRALIVAIAVSLLALWSWVQYTWFATVFENDDALIRICTTLHLVGTVVFVLGIPEFFRASLMGDIHGVTLIAGYLGMRLAAVLLWVRAGAGDPEEQDRCFSHAFRLLVLAAGWGALFLPPVPLWALTIGTVGLVAAELWLSPVTNARFRDTSFNGGHWADRFGVLTLVLLTGIQFGLLSPVTSYTTLWGIDQVIVVAVIASLLTVVGLWWILFAIPRDSLLNSHKERITRFTGIHLITLIGIMLVQAGLAYTIRLASTHMAGTGDAVVAIVLLALALSIVVAMAYLTRPLIFGSNTSSRFERIFFAASLFTLLLAIIVTALVGSLVAGLFIACLAPWITVIGFENIINHVEEGSFATTESAEGHTNTPPKGKSDDESASEEADKPRVM